jgi:hypothetical protein
VCERGACEHPRKGRQADADDWSRHGQSFASLKGKGQASKVKGFASLKVKRQRSTVKKITSSLTDTLFFQYQTAYAAGRKRQADNALVPFDPDLARTIPSEKLELVREVVGGRHFLTVVGQDDVSSKKAGVGTNRASRHSIDNDLGSQ